MIKRDIAVKILNDLNYYPVLAIVGPRQSGKTTLAKNIFKDKPYINLEDLENRSFAQDDPKGFLAQFPNAVVIDEVQRVPELLSYI
ncbi:MAG TPA: AAA family ATPase, partial [Trueperaceae bacterium]|nr:AAA family ATPase [Trueperaceae bacterium]